MTHHELEALLEEHDRWSAYDIVVGVLLTAFGLLLIAAGFVGLWGQMTGIAGLAVVAGVFAIAWALHREPYAAR
jgi:hypothetical protein